MSKVGVIGRNIRFMVLSRIVAVAVSFVLLPFIVRHTGQELYGVYLIVMTATGYFGLLDLGVMSALTKYVSEFVGRGDAGAMNRIINASFSFYVIVGFIAAILLFLCALYFHRFFPIDPTNVATAKMLFLAAAVSALFIWPLSTFRGTIEGLNLWNIEAIVTMFVQVANAVVTFAIFASGYGIVTFFIASQLLTLAGGLMLLCISRKRIRLHISFPCVDGKTFRLIFGFSFFTFLGSLINVFLFQIHNLIIGFCLSMSAVTVYSVAYNIQNYLRAINSTIGAPPWTMASEMEGRGDYEGQRALLFKGTKYMSVVFLPVIIIMFFFAGPFIQGWMGPGFRESVLPARIIILFWLFNGTLELAIGMLSAKGIVRQPVFIQLAVAISNVIIAVTFIKIIGITAIAVGLTFSMVVIGAPLYLRLSLKALNLPFRDYFSNAIKGNLVLYLFVALCSFGTIRYWYPENIYSTLFEMAAIYLVSLGLYYLLILRREERREIRRLAGVDILYDKMGMVRERLNV
jgi:O-antigen/teichoic acid export membrane protein